MEIIYNNTFKQFLDEFKISENFDFDIILPKKVQKILNEEIINNEDSIYLKSF
jgi:hypothetical protein